MPIDTLPDDAKAALAVIRQKLNDQCTAMDKLAENDRRQDVVLAKMSENIEDIHKSIKELRTSAVRWMKNAGIVIGTISAAISIAVTIYEMMGR